jgi:hypothetical protein
MATLTISQNDCGDYCIKETEPIVVPCDGKLVIHVPRGGCRLCFDKDFKGKKCWPLYEDQDIHLKHEPMGVVHYDIISLSERCPKERAVNAAHSIQIGN